MVITINGVCFLFIKFMNQDFYELLGCGTVSISKMERSAFRFFNVKIISDFSTLNFTIFSTFMINLLLIGSRFDGLRIALLIKN